MEAKIPARPPGSDNGPRPHRYVSAALVRAEPAGEVTDFRICQMLGCPMNDVILDIPTFDIFRRRPRSTTNDVTRPNQPHKALQRRRRKSARSIRINASADHTIDKEGRSNERGREKEGNRSIEPDSRNGTRRRDPLHALLLH